MVANTLVLGGGYVGGRLAGRLKCAATHRDRKKCTERHSHYFDLAEVGSWNNLAVPENVVWTFPAAPLDQVKAFYKARLEGVRKLFVYASTSCYITERPDEVIDETHPLDLSQARVAGEEWLREQGATVLVLAGIYGPNRQPLDWLKKGLIKTPDKRVNLIHVEDIVAITVRLLRDERPLRGERFNLSNGESPHWHEIAGHYGLTFQAVKEGGISKQVSNVRICDWLGGYQFQSVMGSA